MSDGRKPINESDAGCSCDNGNDGRGKDGGAVEGFVAVYKDVATPHENTYDYWDGSLKGVNARLLGLATVVGEALAALPVVVDWNDDDIPVINVVLVWWVAIGCG